MGRHARLGCARDRLKLRAPDPRSAPSARLAVEVPMYEENRLPATTDHATLPADVLLIVPVRNVVMFPGAVTQVALGRDISMRAAQEAVTHGYKLGIVLQKDPSVDVP